MDRKDLFDGDMWHQLQERHTQQGLDAEQERMRTNRAGAFLSIVELMKLIELHPEARRTNKWPDYVLILWSRAVTYTTLAITGQMDGWFNTAYPWPDELLKELWAHDR